MGETTVTKINSRQAPRGPQGQKALARGQGVALRLWEDEHPGEDETPSRRDYETVGYVLKGRAELHIEGQVVTLAEGDSWVVPRGTEHTYKILEAFTAIEATHPPAQSHGQP